MLEEKKNKLKELFSFNANGDNKKKIENLVIFVIILIITIIFINIIWNDDDKNNGKTLTNTDKVLAQSENKISINKKIEDDEEDLETRLENILQSIQGVGKVKVLLTYSESNQTLAMYNEDNTKSDTEESDSRSEEIEK